MKSHLTILFAAAILVSGCFDDTPVEVPQPLTPDFILTDIEGNSFQLSSTKGSVVMIHFFAPWCQVCQAEASTINDMHHEYAGRGLVIVGLAVQTDSARVKAFVDDYRVPFRVMVDNVIVSDAYGVESIPTTYLLDREGRIANQFVGPRTKEDFTALIQALL